MCFCSLDAIIRRYKKEDIVEGHTLNNAVCRVGAFISQFFIHMPRYSISLPGSTIQPVSHLTVDPGVASLNSQLSYTTFMAIDHGIISSYSPTCTDSRRTVVNYWQKYVQEVLMNCLED